MKGLWRTDERSPSGRCSGVCWPAHAGTGAPAPPGPGPDPIIITSRRRRRRPRLPSSSGAGDIADCGAADRGASAEATAKLLDRIAGTVFTTGDNVVFQRHGGRFPELLRPALGAPQGPHYPSPGNHEYSRPGRCLISTISATAPGRAARGFTATPSGTGTSSRSTARSASRRGRSSTSGCGAISRPTGLVEAATRTRCTLAYWHHPLFTSGPSGGTSGADARHLEPAHEFGVDVAITGHDHLYERHAPQDGLGRRDAFGIQEFIVGTGGAPLYNFGGRRPEQPVPAEGVWRAQADAARRRLRLGVHRSRHRGCSTTPRSATSATSERA